MPRETGVRGTHPGTGRAGLAFGLIKFVLIFVVGALLYVGLDRAFQEIMSAQAAHTDTQAAATGADWIAQGWEWMPFIIALLAFVMLLSRAFLERDIGGGI